MQGEQDIIFFIVQLQCMVVFFFGALLDFSVWREVKRRHIAFANQTIILPCDNVLLSLRPTQIEVYPGHGGAHSGGHAGAWARAQEGYHSHLLRYDAVWAQLQPNAHFWICKLISQKVLLLVLSDVAFGWILALDFTTIFFYFPFIFAVRERIDNKTGSRSRGRSRGWAVQSPAGENVRLRRRSNNIFI